MPMTVLVEYVEVVDLAPVVLMVVEVDMLLVGMAVAVDIILGDMVVTVVDIVLEGMVVTAVDTVEMVAAVVAMVATPTMLLVADMLATVVTMMELPVAVMLATSTVLPVVDSAVEETTVPLAILVETPVGTVLQTTMVQAITTVELPVVEASAVLVAVSAMEVSLLLLLLLVVVPTVVVTLLEMRLVSASVATIVLEDFLVAGQQDLGLTSCSTMAKTTCWATATSLTRKRRRIDESAAPIHDSSDARCCRSFVYPSCIGSTVINRANKNFV